MSESLKYKCLKCDEIVTGIFKETPQRGTYVKVKCECGNQGLSNWFYNIKGFEKVVGDE